VRRHREHDRLDPRHLRVVDVHAFELPAHARDELHHALERPHLLQHSRGGEEVVERELTREETPLHLLLLVLLDRLLAFSISVSTSPMPRMRDAIRSGWKTSSWSSFSPTEANLTGLPVIALTGERGAAARISVELGQDDAVERDPLLEGLRDGDGLLAGHRVEDEQHVERLHRVAHVASSSMSASSIWRPAGGVDDHDVAAVGGRALEPLARGDDRVRRLGAVDGQLELPAELLELVDRRGALQVGGDEAGLLLLVLAQVERELRRRGRLAEPWRPQRRTTVGGRPNASRESAEPISSVSSSCTILTTCWPGSRPFSTSCPSARPARTRRTA
jgi:hypothetical protein